MIDHHQLIELVRDKRWFGDKSRKVDSAKIIWAIDVGQSGREQLVIVQVEFADGAPSIYLLALDTQTGKEITESKIVTDWIRDAPNNIAAKDSRIGWRSLSGLSLPNLEGLTGIPLAVEQSNTSVRYGESVLVKVNRKLGIGMSPEAELAVVIAKAQDSSFAPQTFGLLTLDGVFPEPVCLATYAEFVPNYGDAWDLVLDELGDLKSVPGQIKATVEALGDITGRMHLGLLSDPWRADVAAEPISTNQISVWMQAARDELDRLLITLNESATPLDKRSAPLIPLLDGSRQSLSDQIDGFSAMRQTWKIRVHGDYHLAQLLRRTDGQYMIVDFDGEPHRSIAERRMKYSALRDVAGMLRSFSYARGTVELAGSDLTSAFLREWEVTARKTFLDAYLARARNAPVAILPTADDDVRRALGALEIEKAIYECWYELNNRPDWLWLPLSRLIRAG